MLSVHQCCGGCNGGFVMVAGEFPGYPRLELSGGVMANPAAGYVLVYTRPGGPGSLLPARRLVDAGLVPGVGPRIRSWEGGVLDVEMPGQACLELVQQAGHGATRRSISPKGTGPQGRSPTAPPRISPPKSDSMCPGSGSSASDPAGSR
jgi:hypothetical protein